MNSVFPMSDGECGAHKFVEQHFAATVQVDDVWNIALRADGAIATANDSTIDLSKARVQTRELCCLAGDADDDNGAFPVEALKCVTGHCRMSNAIKGPVHSAGIEWSARH